MMSQEAVVEFLDAVPENEQLQQRLVAILKSSENDHEDVTKLANEYGYDITSEQLWAEIQKRKEEALERQESGKLTDEELEAIAGGEFLVSEVARAISATAYLLAQLPLFSPH